MDNFQAEKFDIITSELAKHIHELQVKVNSLESEIRDVYSYINSGVFQYA